MSCHFNYLGTSFYLDSDLAQDSEWLLKFLDRSSQFSQHPTCRVQMRQEPGLSSSRHSGGSLLERLEAFKLDSRFQELEVLKRDPLKALEPAHGWALEFVQAGQIRMLYDDHTPLLERRLGLLRLIRELATTHSEARGDLILHASSLVYGGSAVAFVGPKRAGKSTTLLHCLRSHRTQYLANDRLRLEPSTLEAEEIPTVLSLRSGTLDRLPDLRTALSKLQKTWYGDVRNSSPLSASSQEALFLSAAQLCRALKKQSLQKASLKALIFPQIQPHRAQTAASEFLPSSEELQHALFSPGLKRKTPLPNFPPASRELPQQLQALRDCGLRFYRWELGPDSLREVEEVEELLASLGE